MPRPPSPDLRRTLVERAAAMLAERQPVTLRSLVAGTGASTMAVYTYFGGMDGLWRAVRQEGFVRLADDLALVEVTDDPVRDLVALSAAYVAGALARPHLYRTMFDAGFDLEDPEAADASFGRLVDAAARARAAGRFDRRADPASLATRWWAYGHGLTSLVLTGVLPAEVLDDHVTPVATALFVAAGDEPARCRRSVRAGWRHVVLPEPLAPGGAGPATMGG